MSNTFTWLESLYLIPIYFLYLGTFILASREKFFSKGVPEWFHKQFEPTFLGKMQWLRTTSYYLIASLEALSAILFLISAYSLEFLPGHDHSYLIAALLVALFVFVILGMGLRLSNDYQGAANLFSYFGVTLLAFIFVLALPFLKSLVP